MSISCLEQGELVETRPRSAKEPVIEVLGHVCREIRVHPHDLNFAEFDTLGTFLMVGSSEHGKIFLCDTKTNSALKLSPVPQRGGLSGRGKKPKFKVKITLIHCDLTIIPSF